MISSSVERRRLVVHVRSSVGGRARRYKVRPVRCRLEPVGAVGDPDDDRAPSRRRVADRAGRGRTRRERSSRRRASRGRRGSRARSAPGASTSGGAGSISSASRTAGSRPSRFAVLELLEVAGGEEHQPEARARRWLTPSSNELRVAFVTAISTDQPLRAHRELVDGEEQPLPGARIALAPVELRVLRLGGAGGRERLGFRGASAARSASSTARRAVRRIRAILAARLAAALDLYEYQGKQLFKRFGIPSRTGGPPRRRRRRARRRRRSAARSSSRRRC